MPEMTDEPDWEAPPGTTKRKCPSCRHWFASRDGATVCPTCKSPSSGSAYQRGRSVSPFDPMGGPGFRRGPKGSVRG